MALASSWRRRVYSKRLTLSVTADSSFSSASGLLYGASVVELLQPVDDVVDFLRIDLLLLQELAQLFGVGRALAGFATELAHLLG